MTTTNDRRIRYGLDTDTASAQQRGRTAVIDRIAANGQETIPTTVVTMDEQFRGRMVVVDRAREELALQQAYRLLEEGQNSFCEMVVLPFDAVASTTYRSLIAQRRSPNASASARKISASPPSSWRTISRSSRAIGATSSVCPGYASRIGCGHE